MHKSILIHILCVFIPLYIRERHSDKENKTFIKDASVSFLHMNHFPSTTIFHKEDNTNIRFKMRNYKIFVPQGQQIYLKTLA